MRSGQPLQPPICANMGEYNCQAERKAGPPVGRRQIAVTGGAALHRVHIWCSQCLLAAILHHFLGEGSPARTEAAGATAVSRPAGAPTGLTLPWGLRPTVSVKIRRPRRGRRRRAHDSVNVRRPKRHDSSFDRRGAPQNSSAAALSAGSGSFAAYASAVPSIATMTCVLRTPKHNSKHKEVRKSFVN